MFTEVSFTIAPIVGIYQQVSRSTQLPLTHWIIFQDLQWMLEASDTTKPYIVSTLSLHTYLGKSLIYKLGTER